jgi:hypothetical protein
VGKNPNSRLPNSEFGDLVGCKLAVAEYIAKQIPFRFDSTIKKTAKNREALQAYID